MKKLMMMFAALAAVVGMTAGCFTKAVAYTKTNPDGSKESRVTIVGTGDKASQIAAEGLFADGASEDLGAGVRTASASQQSIGIKETLEGMGVLLTGIGSLVAKTQGLPVAAIAPVSTDTKPELAVGVGGGSAGTGGAQPSSGIVGAALEKLMGIVGGTAAKGAALTPSEAQAVSAAAAAATAQP